MKDLAFWKHLANGPGTTTLTNSSTFDVLSMIGGTKPANLKYLVLMMRLDGANSAIWINAQGTSNTHFVLKQEELGKLTDDPSERIYSGIQFKFDASTWVLSTKGCYYTHTYWHDNYGNIEITANSHHNIGDLVFTFYGIEGVFY